jgi:tetratricopeptide (TPR) repeat protein
MKRVCAILASLILAATTVWAAGFDWEKAVSLYKQGQFRAAIAEFQNVVAEFPNHADSWKFMGLAYYQLKDYEQAVAPLERALELKRAESKTDADVLLALGRIQVALKRYDKALTYLETMTKQQPGVAANFYMLGVAYSNLNRVDDATAAFRAAVKLDAKDGDSWYYLGILQFRANKFDEAITALRSGVTAAPKHAEMLGLLAEVLLRRGGAEANEQKASVFFEEAVQTATKLKALRDDAASTELLGRAFLAAKKYTNAEMTLERALAMTREPSAALYFNTGLAHVQSKAWARAAEVLQQADRLNPGDVNTLYYLGFVYENLRKYPQALDAYSRAYEASGRANADIKASIDRVTPFAKPN